MGYSGREQYWCEKGHYSVTEPLPMFDEDPETCSTCGSEIVFCNSVDDTNGEEINYIEPVVKIFAKVEKCDKGFYHEVEEATYEIPTEKDRTFLTGAGKRLNISLYNDYWNDIERKKRRGETKE
jgi:hypothetical protein